MSKQGVLRDALFLLQEETELMEVFFDRESRESHEFLNGTNVLFVQIRAIRDQNIFVFFRG